MKNVKIGEVMSSSIKSSTSKDLATDISNVAFSEVITSEALADVPVIGLLVKSYNVLATVQGEIYTRKLYNFFSTIQHLTLEEKARVMDEISNEKGGVDMAGLLLLDFIDKSDDNVKPMLIGKLFVACAFCEITTQAFLKLSSIVNNIFIDDLKKLADINNTENLSEEIKSIYVANGLMNLSIKRPQKESQGFSVSELGDAIFGQGLSLSHDLSDDGKLLAKICFDAKY